MLKTIPVIWIDVIIEPTNDARRSLNNNKANIVVVGGGFCGITALKLLEQVDCFQVTLIDTKDFFEYTPSMVQAFTDANIESSATVPYTKVLTNSHFVQGHVSTVCQDRVILDNRIVPFDYLVLSTGATYGQGMKMSNTSASFRRKTLTHMRRNMFEAKRVLIVGAGA
jgi:NADH dehydrogenase FAD-containing subunit